MRHNVFLFLLLLPFFISAQSFPLQDEFAWDDNFVNYKPLPDSLKTADAVILREQLDIGSTYIKRRVAVKINSEKALNEFSSLQLPENFDLTNYPHLNKQGRFKNRKDPFIYSYKIQYFAARVIKNNKKIIDVKPKHQAKKVMWINLHGDHFYDYISDLEIGRLEAGDILEYTYKAYVDWRGGQSVIYPNSVYPKLDYNLKIVTHFASRFKNIILVYDYNIPKEQVTVSTEHKSGEEVDTHSYHFDFLKGISYPEHAVVGLTLPNIAINHGAYTMVTTGINLKTQTVFDKYKWILRIDTLQKIKIYDKYHTNLRKFMSKFPEDKADTTGSVFFSQLTDTMNAMKFSSAEELSYDEEAQYSVVSSEQLNKGKLPEEFVYKAYDALLSERSVFFYTCHVIDRRYSSVNAEYRNHYYMERLLLAIPEKKSFRYYMPRFRGVKYFPDELPFYFEGTKCVMMPCYNCAGNSKNAQLLFVTTPKSTTNENVRTENASCKVITDSFKIAVNIKENLSGQFSTLLRHCYSKDYIDSTVPANYFKKCVNKPHATGIKSKQISGQKQFPFKHSYACNEQIAMGSRTTVDLTNWFSFPWSREQFPKTPNHDFFMDFPCTDVYNYLFEFDKPAEITNPEDFSKKLSNDYFEVSSSLVKQEDAKYLLNITVKVKQVVIPQRDGTKLVEFAEMLDQINNFKLQLKS
ncbi:MAG: hypothetical protein ACXVPQ_00705 [Bacteroidia bacterium]